MLSLLVEQTQSLSYAMWEEGGLNPLVGNGYATLVAGPNGEKLKVIYDKNPQKNRAHNLYVLDIGHLVSKARIRHLSDKTVGVDLHLLKVDMLYSENVQGHPVPKARVTPIWSMKTVAPHDDVDRVLKEYNSDTLGYAPEVKELLAATLTKAMTPFEEQKMFWGIPRNAELAA
jgi:hypothetical protein